MKTTGKRKPSPRRHPATADLLDYLEGRSGDPARRAIEEHVASPCTACGERLREFSLLLERMKRDRVPEVSDALRRRALDVFQPAAATTPQAVTGWLAGKLLFDSLTQAPAGAFRDAVGEARRLAYALGEAGEIEFECEREGPGVVNVRGRLGMEDAELYRIELRVGQEERRVWPDAAGHFAVEQVPAGTLRITIDGPDGRWRLEPVRLDEDRGA